MIREISMKQNILKLTTAAFVGLFATSAQASWSVQEYEALFEAKPSLLKKLADEIVDSGGSDAFEAQLGAGGLDVVKTRIGAGGNTGVDVDLDAQIARIEGGNPTLKVAIDDTKALINSGVAGNTLMQDIQAEADIAEGGPAANLHAAIANRIAANPFPGAGLLLIPTADAAHFVADAQAQLDRIAAPRPASFTVGLNGVKTALGTGNGTTVVADINTEIGNLNAVSGSVSVDLTNSVADMVAAVPGAAVLAKVEAGTTLGTLDARLDAQKLRIDNTPAASIDAGLDAAEILVPIAGAALVQNLGTIKGTIDGGAVATLPLAVTAAAHKIDAAAADIPAGIVAAVAKINAGSADIPAAIAAAAPKIDTGGATTIPAAIAAAAAKLYGFTSTGGGAFINTTTVAYAGAAGDLPALITYFIN